MKKSLLFRIVCLSLLVIGATAVMHANAIITGSLPFAGVGVTNSGASSLKGPSTALTAVASITTGNGTGNFALVPLLTQFGPFSLDLATISGGGGFTLSNTNFGSFVATSGVIVTVLPTFLNVDLLGVYTPGPGLQPQGPGSNMANLNLSFTQNGQSLSASGTLAAVPEVNTLLLIGTGMLGIASKMHFTKKHRAL